MPGTWERTVCGIGAEETSLSLTPPVDASIGRSVPFLSDAPYLILKLYTISTISTQQLAWRKMKAQPDEQSPWPRYCTNFIAVLFFLLRYNGWVVPQLTSAVSMI